MYYAYITKIQNVRKHNNADKLQVAQVLGNEIVVGLDYQAGDIVCFFPSDGQLSKEFAEVNKLTRELGGYFESNCKVRAQKFRGEISDGFACKLTLLENFVPGSTKKLSVGDRINEIDGKPLCNKFVTEATKKAAQPHKQGKKRNRGSTLTFPKHHDTEQLTYFLHRLKNNQQLIIQEKIHGTSHRIAFTLEEVDLPKWKKFINKFFLMFKTQEYALMSGSRNVILANADDGLPNLNMRQQVTKYFEGKLNKGEIVFMELAGYDGEKPIMPAHSTKKLNDKEFTKQYGDKIIYDYGCTPGTFEIYVYRIAQINEDGDLVDYTHDMVIKRAEELGLKTPPVLAIIQVESDDPDRKSLMEKIDSLANQKSSIGNHWSEGVCVRINSSKWECYKHKNTYFKIMEGIIKENEDYVDAEESS